MDPNATLSPGEILEDLLFGDYDRVLDRLYDEQGLGNGHWLCSQMQQGRSCYDRRDHLLVPDYPVATFCPGCRLLHHAQQLYSELSDLAYATLDKEKKL